jgi:hypothetical protein
MKSISGYFFIFFSSLSIIHADMAFTGSYTSPGCEGGMTYYKCESYFLDSDDYTLPNFKSETKNDETESDEEGVQIKKEISAEDWEHFQQVMDEADRAMHPENYQ